MLRFEDNSREAIARKLLKTSLKILEKIVLRLSTARVFV
ncbi:hypothetical protein CKA32_003854 [Geitlerinema sp. FC II]|nr:hypothetical protein CKA32_003854 [Geitlerinema sp. FC II]